MNRRARWRRALYLTGLITAHVKVVMFALHEHMREDGRVSVPLSTMSAKLGIAPRRVLAAYAAAIDAGLLDRVSPGYHGHTAEYQALLPGPGRVSKASTLHVSESDTLSPRERVSFPSTPLLSAAHPDSATDSDAVAHDEERSDETTPSPRRPTVVPRTARADDPANPVSAMTAARPQQRTATVPAQVGDSLPTTAEAREHSLSIGCARAGAAVVRVRARTHEDTP